MSDPKAIADELRAEGQEWRDTIGEFPLFGSAADAIDSLVTERDEALADNEDTAANHRRYWKERAEKAERERDDLQAERDKLIEVVRKVRAYADDRAFHSRRHNNTVNSGRIASDLYHILNDASLGSSTQWQYSYAEKWVDNTGVNERVTFDTEAEARNYFADNSPNLVEYNAEVKEPTDRLKAVLEKRRVVEPGDWLPLEAMTVDPSTNV